MSQFTDNTDGGFEIVDYDRAPEEEADVDPQAGHTHGVTAERVEEANVEMPNPWASMSSDTVAIPEWHKDMPTYSDHDNEAAKQGYAFIDLVFCILYSYNWTCPTKLEKVT